MIAMKTVLLVESGDFLGGVISSLFSRLEEVCLIEVSPNNASELIKAVKRHTPQYVVLDDTMNNQFLSLLLRHMRKNSGFQVVVVGADSNQVEVYQKQEIPVHHSADFFAVF
jgi:chemotaxis response regulator CheB